MRPVHQQLNGIKMCITTTDAPCVKGSGNSSLNSISLSWVNLQVNSSVWEFNNENKNSSILSQIPKRRRKTILPLLSGHFNLHSLNGVLGPSGSGKTTLLNCLSGRRRPSSGLITYYPHQTYSKKKLLSSSSQPSIVFIEQNAHETSLIRDLTVGQILHYAYCFKNGRVSLFLNSQKTFQIKIQEVLQEMMLPLDILERKYSKCSGGEQRRVALVQELLSENRLPDFWFIDEPTSGLDSQSALVVIQCLNRLALAQPVTIVASIHVPNEQTLALFDSLVILAKGGLCIYSGLPSSLECTLERKVGLKVAAHQKPIEVAIKVAFDGSDANQIMLANDVLKEEFSLLNYHQKTSMISPTNTQHSTPALGRSFRLVDLITQLSRQFSRTFISGWRTFLFQLLFYIGNILLLASVFDKSMVLPNGCSVTTSFLFDEDENDILKLNATNSSSSLVCDATPLTDKLLIVENINYLSFGRIFQAFPLVLNSISAFGSLARVFRREHRNKWYSLGSFYWATSLLSLLEMTLVVGVISTVIYFAGGEQAIDGGVLNWRRFGHFTFSLWLYYLFHQSGGQFVGVLLLDHLHLAMALGYTLIPIANIFDDFFFKVDDLGNPSFVFASELVGAKYLTRYMIYAFYGVDRCGGSRGNLTSVDGSSPSWLLEKHHVDPQAVPFYIIRVLINIFILRAITLAIMYGKFSDLFGSLKKICGLQKKVEDLDKNGMLSLKLFSEKNSMITIDVMGNEVKNKMEDEFVDENNNQIKTPKSKEGFEEERNKSPILIAWDHLTLHRNASLFNRNSSKSSVKPILQNVSGHLRFGTLTALIGMSGAGKTSLLRVLNGQLGSRIDGMTRFYVNTCQKVRTCFIAQEVSAHLLPGLTARQTLEYASRLKNSNGAAQNGCNQKEFHRMVADRFLEELGLLDAAETTVQRCSGGELRRLSIAVELTSSAEEMPNLMCADEPTTGLDSTSAALIISTLHRISRLHGIAILASVHQPSPELLATCFDQIYLLAGGGGGGTCVYFGPPRGIAAHLARVPSIDQTESKYLIEVLVRYSCLGSDHPTVRQLIEINDEKMKTKDKFQEKTVTYAGPRSPRVRFSLTSTVYLLSRYLRHFTGYLWTQALAFLLIYISWTLTLHFFFDPSIANIDGCFSLEEDFTNGNVCNLLPNETIRRSAIERGLENNLKYNLFFNNGFFVIVTMQTTFLFFADLQIFSTEHRNGWYSSGAFYLSKTVTEVVPAALLLPLYVYFCDIYSEHLRESIYPALLLTFALAVFAAQGLGHVIVLLAPRSLSTVILLNMAALVGSFLLSNVPVTLNRMHYVYQLAAGFSFSRFSNEASFLLEYGFGRCGEDQIQAILLWMGLGGGGDESEHHYHDLLRSWLALVANGVLYRVAAICLLVRFANSKSGDRKKANFDKEEVDKLPTNKEVV